MPLKCGKGRQQLAARDRGALLPRASGEVRHAAKRIGDIGGQEVDGGLVALRRAGEIARRHGIVVEGRAHGGPPVARVARLHQDAAGQFPLHEQAPALHITVAAVRGKERDRLSERRPQSRGRAHRFQEAPGNGLESVATKVWPLSSEGTMLVRASYPSCPTSLRSVPSDS